MSTDGRMSRIRQELDRLEANEFERRAAFRFVRLPGGYGRALQYIDAIAKQRHVRIGQLPLFDEVQHG